ncbi:hypothetical protein [Rhizorhabdus histidinilytica]|uniref:hypothetical protein n=1 Tax=Rhizorhabdus histidinilytica TaxID=439228 RepID=UPI00063FC0BE|nr:hypothetical protein [Sphingomonas sp. Y57]
MSAPIDEYTRWTCERCGKPGFDSWNKAMHDGIYFAGDYPNPAIFGVDCQDCGHPAVLAYTTPHMAPRAVFGPHQYDYAYEPAAMSAFQTDPHFGVELRPSSARDRDWRGGCLSAVLGITPDPAA